MRKVVVTGLGCVSPLGNSAEETWKGIEALSSEAGICGLIEVQQELSSLCLHFENAIMDFYGENSDTDNAISEFYDKSKAMDGMITEWLGTMLYAHFAVTR